MSVTCQEAGLEEISLEEVRTWVLECSVANLHTWDERGVHAGVEAHNVACGMNGIEGEGG